MKASAAISIFFAAIMVIMAVPPPAHAGEIIEVRNNSDTDTFVLSDLIVKGKNGEKSTVLKLGDASDDTTLAPRKSVTFDVGFDIVSYFISRTGSTGEHETNVFDVTFPGFIKVGMVENADLGPAVFAAMDFNFPAADPLASDSVTQIIDGLSPLLPGWFFGTSVDFDAFNIGNPFTGNVRFLSDDISVAVLPQPATLLLLIGGGLALIILKITARQGPRTELNLPHLIT